MLKGLWTRAFRREFARKALASAALVGVAFGSTYAFAETRAEPFPAWPEPVIQDKMSVDEAKAIVAERTKPQTEWKGPTDGPKAPAGSFTIAYVSPDQSYTPHVLWGKGVEEGAKALGWKVMTFNGQGTVSGTLGRNATGARLESVRDHHARRRQCVAEADQGGGVPSHPGDRHPRDGVPRA